MDKRIIALLAAALTVGQVHAFPLEAVGSFLTKTFQGRHGRQEAVVASRATEGHWQLRVWNTSRPEKRRGPVPLTGHKAESRYECRNYVRQRQGYRNLQGPAGIRQ